MTQCMTMLLKDYVPDFTNADSNS